MKKINLALLGLLLLAPSFAWAAGGTTNGVPLVPPGVTYTPSNGTANAAGISNYTYQGQLGGYELDVIDTMLGAGAQPQTVAGTTFQHAALGAMIAANTATASAGAATLNTTIGLVTSESISTAAGSNYVLTLTDSAILATSAVQAMVGLGTCAAAGQALGLVSVVPTAGSVVITVKNVGTAALAACTIKVAFQTR